MQPFCTIPKKLVLINLPREFKASIGAAGGGMLRIPQQTTLWACLPIMLAKMRSIAEEQSVLLLIICRVSHLVAADLTQPKLHFR